MRTTDFQSISSNFEKCLLVDQFKLQFAINFGSTAICYLVTQKFEHDPAYQRGKNERNMSTK